MKVGQLERVYVSICADICLVQRRLDDVTMRNLSDLILARDAGCTAQCVNSLQLFRFYNRDETLSSCSLRFTVPCYLYILFEPVLGQSFPLTRAPLGYFYNAPHWGGAISSPPSDLRNYWADSKNSSGI